MSNSRLIEATLDIEITTLTRLLIKINQIHCVSVIFDAP